VIQRLAIVGVGLLGGSVALGARAQGIAREIVGVGRSAERLAPAVRAGVLDRATTDIAAGVADADFVLLAATVAANEKLLETVWQAAPAGAVVTDVGSTKRGIVRAATRLEAVPRVAFVGSHPMAGSERSGWAAARPDLFAGATVIVTPTEATESAALKSVSGFWEALGGRVSPLDPDTHDLVVALISHLPHLIAVALVDAVADTRPAALEFAGRGFKDTTRIAAGDAHLWQEIFLGNRDALTAGVGAFRSALDSLVARVAVGDTEGLERALERTASIRRRLT
jgi:prephenate dehydrogenase